MSTSVLLAFAKTAMRGCCRLLAFSSLFACTSTPPELDKPLQDWQGAKYTTYADEVAHTRDPELLVLVAFSGGGTRAAALSYGVMQELSATTIHTSHGEVSLLDEVDIISSVSGGSFTSAYYGLFGDRLFEDFESKFLRQDIESDLIKRLLTPTHWAKLSHATYGRSDDAAEFYDQQLYGGKTLADFRYPESPLIVINSTDINSGARVPFIPALFDMLCIDLADYPVAKAVAASSAMPGLATPMTLQNYAGSCDFQPGNWLQADAVKGETTLRKDELQALERYLDAKDSPWLHLVDGGISDNLGLRAFYSILKAEQDPQQVFKALGHHEVRQILIVSVNASIFHLPDWSAKAHPPNLVDVLIGSSRIQMHRYTDDTLEIVRTAYEDFVAAQKLAGKDIALNFVEVNFDLVPDAQQRKAIRKMATNYDLDNSEIDLLLQSGRSVLRDSSEYRAFVERNRRN